MGGVVLSDDFSVDACCYEDYSLDNLVSAGVNIPDAPSFQDNSISSFEDVDLAATKILESNDFIINEKDNETKN